MKLKHRYSLSIFVVGFACIVAMVIDRGSITKELLSERASARAEALASAVAREVAEPLKLGDTKTVQERLRLFSELKGVESIKITDMRRVERFSEERRFGLPEKDALMRTANEIISGPNGEALSLEILISSDGIRNTVLLVLARGVFWGAISILLLALASWWLGDLAGRKIDSLVDAVARLDADSGAQLPDLNRNSEIGALSRAFQRLGRKLKEETAQRARLEEQRDDMINMLVHDMKHPLTIFRLSMAVLNDAARASESKEIATALSLAGRSTMRLEAMLDGVLQSARLAHDPAPQERVRLEILPYMEQCGDEDALIAKSCGRPWRMELDPALKTRFVLARPEMLRRLLGNLVLNAVEHSPRGTPLTLGARLAGADESSVELFVSNVADDLNLDPASLLHEKYRGSGGNSHAGLGLAFCQLAAKEHLGRMDARRAENGRVVFSLKLPMLRQVSVPIKTSSPQEVAQ